MSIRARLSRRPERNHNSYATVPRSIQNPIVQNSHEKTRRERRSAAYRVAYVVNIKLLYVRRIVTAKGVALM
jgi:hypothetical protein